MASDYITAANVVSFSDSDLEGVSIKDILNSAPLVAALPVRTTEGTQLKYIRRTGDPSVGFRDVNDGTENKKATRELVTLNLKFLDAKFDMDIAAEQQAPGLYGDEAQAHLEAAFFAAEEAIINGDADAGDGLADIVDEADDEMFVDGGAAETTGEGLTSVYAVYVGPGGVELVAGNDGVIKVSEPFKTSVDGETEGTFTALRTDINAWMGLKYGTYSVGRIGNIDASDGDSADALTDSMLASLIAKFPGSRKPQMIVMNSTAQAMLRNSRTATNPTGNPAPFPTEAFGASIIVTDAITNAETYVS